VKTNLVNQPLHPTGSCESKNDTNLHFDFSYELKAGGKATGQVIFNSNEIEYEVTNSGNPLFELLKGMAKLIFEPSHIWVRKM